MPILSPKLEVPLSSPDLPFPIMFRSAHVPAGGLYPQHRHAWGEFVYSFSGIMEVKLADRHYLAPPQYGVWLPPEVTHIGLNRFEAVHCSVYITPPVCQALPRNPCALTVSPVVRALLDHLRQQPAPQSGPPPPISEQEGRLLQVLVDLLAQAPCAGSYLPTSDDPALSALLRQLEAHPGDNRSLAALAHTIHTTERTLMRRCQRDLGMSLNEWRQRLRVIKAMTLLEAGQTVETIALDLGYGGASAFIAMFKRLMSATPDEYRRGGVGKFLDKNGQ
ncbi:helix-turn-helix domain-containing protein [Rhodoferax sp. PAMC 29310]|uniref:AraC family transcriptional regulator n=1 Tax=Rhodoferax sp. PAMC 29310 TaxID=2822760 RepID=UPI001B3289ED|nr:helix-turn-helix transcriptional regulator [Rhodoferax sp. PAMC 29310]